MSSGCLTENEVQALLNGALATARVDGVQAHIDACLNCQLLVSAGVRTTSLRSHGIEREPAELVHLEVGQVVSDRYRITRFIARGGMGEVYAAYDEMLGEEIALKILLRPARAGAAALTRLRAEVQLARRVADPHVLRVFDIGSCQSSRGDGDGEEGEILFLTMQLLQGETLRELIRRSGPLAPTEVWRLAGDMLAALCAAHGKGVVHSDFKSDNVMLVPAAAGPPQAVVMDFGLAQAAVTDTPSGEQPAPLVAGTVGYMAPEQLSGGAVTEAADVYAFGVVLYEMLTGVLPPFRPNNGRRTPGLAPPPPLRLDALDIPARWRSLIRRCLARHPAARFADMIEVRQAIAGHDAFKRRVVLAGAVIASLAVVAAGAVSVKRAPAAPAVVKTEAVPSSPITRPATAASPIAPAPAALAPVETIDVVPTVRRARRTSAPTRAGAVKTSTKPESPATRDAATGGEADTLERAETLLAQGRAMEACALGEVVAARAPETAAVWKFLGGCHMRLGETARARQYYRKYLALASNDPDSVFVQAIVKQGP